MSMRIQDYALLGDGRSAALVDRHGSVDWLCWPTFDGDTCFAALLGDARHGCWRITPRDPVIQAVRRYRDDGLILETTLVTGSGTLTLQSGATASNVTVTKMYKTTTIIGPNGKPIQVKVLVCPTLTFQPASVAYASQYFSSLISCTE